MALNFNRCNPISSVGLGLGSETTDVRFFLSPTDSNLGLNHVIRDGGLNIDSNLGIDQLGLVSHRVTEVRETYVSPNRVQVHSVIDYVPVQNRPIFPLSAVTVTEVVKTTRFLTSTSTLERMFASNSGVRNQGIFPNNGGVYIRPQPAVSNQANQVMINPFHFQNPSMNYQEALNIWNHANHGTVKRETVFNPPSAYSSQHPIYNQSLSFDQRSIILKNLDNLIKSNYNMNQERGHPSCVNPVRVPTSPSSSSLEEVSDENDYDYPLGYDGRTHSLPDYPDGAYGCPKCFAAFYTSQTFAAHIRAHYKQESKEERRRRMAAKCRGKNLRLVPSSHGLTAVPTQSFKGRKNGKEKVAVEMENLEEVLGLNTRGPAAAERGARRGVVVKEEPM